MAKLSTQYDQQFQRQACTWQCSEKNVLFLFFLLRNEKKAKAVEKAAGKLSGKFLQPLFSMVAIYYSFQDSAGKLEASLGQRINEKDLVYAPRSGQLQAP